MTTQILKFALGWLGFACIANAQQAVDDQIAAQFVPPAFTAYAASHTYLSDDRAWKVMPVDLDHTGHADYLAVAYGNGHIGYLRVIRKDAVPTLAADTAVPVACDSQPTISAVDLDGDGKPELVLACRVGNQGAMFSSLFKWTGSGLSVLNARSKRRPNQWEPLREANFVDIDGDGTLEILESSSNPEVDAKGVVTQSWTVWKLTNGTLVKSSASAVPYFNRFDRSKGKPRAELETFTVTPGAYVLTIVGCRTRRARHAVGGTAKRSRIVHSYLLRPQAVIAIST
jgi:hypothetical protein